MRYDIIILAHSTSMASIEMTKRCIESIKKAEDKIGLDILVLESGNEVSYDGVTYVIYRNPSFNYNHSLNYGISITNNPYILCCNNDLIFHKNFAENLYNAFAMGYKSISPYCNISHRNLARTGAHLIVGSQVGFHIAGWCLGVEREMINSIGGFNEGVDFWYSDNIYGEQLQIAKIKHALVCNAFVDHVNHGSQTLGSLDRKTRIDVTSKQKRKYDKALKKLYNEPKEKVLRKRT